MTSKKTAPSKRANLPLVSNYANAFLKDWTRLTHSGRYNMKQLKEVMVLLIANDQALGAEWLDHPLSGDWSGYRECHVGGDFLLIYRLSENKEGGMIIFSRVGTHAELFN
jgi:mRNA interferase YafQ